MPSISPSPPKVTYDRSILNRDIKQQTIIAHTITFQPMIRRQDFFFRGSSKNKEVKHALSC